MYGKYWKNRNFCLNITRLQSTACRCLLKSSLFLDPRMGKIFFPRSNCAILFFARFEPSNIFFSFQLIFLYSSIALWSSQKKKPLAVVKNAHTPADQEHANWITSICAMRHSDLFASGSCDGHIRLWKADTSKNTITAVLTVPMVRYP